MQRYIAKAVFNVAIVFLFFLVPGPAASQSTGSPLYEENTIQVKTILSCSDSSQYAMTLPFIEDWGGPSGFLFYDWKFCPSQGSWVVSNMTGNPPPAADFQGSTTGIAENYSYQIVSLMLVAREWTCADVFLSFDIKLVDRLMTSTEKMTVELLYSNTWHPVTEYTNDGSFGWRNDTFLLSGAGGHVLKLGFRANGVNRYNFQDWFIDNIRLYGICPPPVNLQGSVSSGCVTLNWDSPCPQQKTVYDIYRSNHYGNPPYLKVNSNEIPDTMFSQTPPWGPSYTYKYYVVALQVDTLNGLEFCESGSSDTVQISFPVVIEGSARDKVRIYPVPANDNIVITGDLMITGLCITDQTGRALYEETGVHSNRIEVKIFGWSPGVYYAKINASGTAKVMKFIIQK